MVDFCEYHEAIFHVIELAFVIIFFVVRLFFHDYLKTKLFGPIPAAKLLMATPAAE
jgi:hypothetical protein